MSAPIFEVGARVRYSHKRAQEVFLRMYGTKRRAQKSFTEWLKTWGWSIGTVVEAHGSLIVVWDDTPDEIGIHHNDGRIERFEAPIPSDALAWTVQREIEARR